MIQKPEETGIPFHVGDRVRTERGLSGKITTRKNDGLTAYVQLNENGGGTHVALYRLDTLKKIVG